MVPKLQYCQFYKSAFEYSNHQMASLSTDSTKTFCGKFSFSILYIANSAWCYQYHSLTQSHKRYSLESKRTFGTWLDFIISIESFVCFYLGYE